MGLAGEDDLDRAPFIVEDFLQPLYVAEDQQGALIGGKTARKAYSERVRVEQRSPGQDSHRARRIINPVSPHAFAHEIQHLALELLVRAPQFSVRNIVDSFP